MRYGLISRPAAGFDIERHGSHLGRDGWTPRPELGTTDDSRVYALWDAMLAEPENIFAVVKVRERKKAP